MAREEIFAPRKRFKEFSYERDQYGKLKGDLRDVAGKNQHHIWQLLQRGFGEKIGKYHHIWVYEKNTPPKRTTTRKHGSEPYFYENSSGATADIILTEFENSTQSYLQAAKNQDSGSELDGNILGPIIAHLEVRSLFFREEISDVLKILTEEFERLTDEKTFNTILLSYLRNHPEILEDQIDAHQLQEPDRKLIRSYFAENEKSLIKKISSELLDKIRTLNTATKAKAAQTAKDSHINALMKGFTEIERANSHRKLSYKLKKTDDKLILPDNVLAFFTRKGVTPFSQKSDEIEEVIFPLAEHIYIQGATNTPTPKSHDTLLRELSSCSYRSFIARDNSEKLSRLSGRIGKNATLISRAEVARLVRLDNLLSL